MLQQIAQSLYLPLDSHHTRQLCIDRVINFLQLNRHTNYPTECKTGETPFDFEPTAEMFGFPSPQSTDQHPDQRILLPR